VVVQFHCGVNEARAEAVQPCANLAHTHLRDRQPELLGCNHSVPIEAVDALLVMEQHLLDAGEVAQAVEARRDVALVHTQLQGGRAQLPLNAFQLALACAVGGLVAAHLQAQVLRGLDLHALQGAL
jgi:hypothetical protein